MQQVVVIASLCIACTYVFLFHQPMKQFTFIALLTMACAFGALFHPFWAILLYYVLAILRPQHHWEWAMPFNVRWSLIAAVLVLLATFMRMPKLLRTGRLNFISGLMLIYCVFLVIAVLTAYNPGLAQQWASEYAKVLLIAMIVPLAIDRMRQVRWLILMAMFCIGYIVYEINSSYFQNHRLDILHSGYGGLDNNGAGLKFAMSLPFAYVFLVIAKQKWLKLAALAIGALTLHAVMLTYSRGAMITAVFGLGWLVIHHRPRYQAGIAAAVLAVMISFMAGQEIRDRFNSTLDYQQDASAQSRMTGWAAAWSIAADHPLTGTGIRNSNQFTRNYGADLDGRTIHNQYLQIAADTGVPALLVYIAMLGGAVCITYRCRRFLLNRAEEIDDPDDYQSIEARDNAVLVLGIQTSLLMFALGIVFLALEVFEMPWMLIALAGALPALTRRECDPLFDGQEDHEPAPALLPQRRHRVMPAHQY